MTRSLIAYWISSLIAGLIIAVLSVPSARADEYRLAPLVDWLVANSALTYAGQPLPEVRAYPTEIIQVERFGAELVDLAARSDETILPETIALYDSAANVILLNSDEDITRDVLVHELVHYLQDVGGTLNEDCIPMNERQAYVLQKAWADAHGVEADLSGMFDAVSRVLDCYGYY